MKFDLRNRLNKTETGKWFVSHWGIISFCVSMRTQLRKEFSQKAPQMSLTLRIFYSLAQSQEALRSWVFN